MGTVKTVVYPSITGERWWNMGDIKHQVDIIKYPWWINMDSGFLTQKPKLKLQVKLEFTNSNTIFTEQKHQEVTGNRLICPTDSIDFGHKLIFASRLHRGLAHAHLHVSPVTPAVPERKNVPPQGGEPDFHGWSCPKLQGPWGLVMGVPLYQSLVFVNGKITDNPIVRKMDDDWGYHHVWTPPHGE